MLALGSLFCIVSLHPAVCGPGYRSASSGTAACVQPALHVSSTVLVLSTACDAGARGDDVITGGDGQGGLRKRLVKKLSLVLLKT